ncbi:MAG: HpcH/HpaI aldolase/citrate lyase family protein [Xenococcaceae cyanobacterium]
MNQLKKKLSQQTCFGIFSKTTDSAFVEAAGIAGLDFIILDTEHGPANFETLHNHVRAAKLTQMASIIRVKGVDSHAISSALDTGADGVQVPNISTAQQAQDVVKAARFYPQGSRGVCRFVRAANFGNQAKDSYFASANEKLVILQVEGLEGINNLDQILEVQGFDVLFIGPYDLSQSVGKPGQVDDPEVLALMQQITQKAQSKGILLGAFSDSLERNVSLKKEGFNYLAYSVDVYIYCEAITSIIKG